MHRLSLVMDIRGYFLVAEWRLLSSCGAQVVGTQASVVAASRLSSVVHDLSCSTACGILPNQELNPGPLHWQSDSYPPCHQGSVRHLLLNGKF